MMKRLISFLSAAAMFFSLIYVQSFAANEIKVEGENYIRSSDTARLINNENFSGTQAVRLQCAGDKIPERGMRLQYKVKVPEDGMYSITIWCSPNMQHMSPCEIKINDGEYIPFSQLGAEKIGDKNNTSIGNNMLYGYKLSAKSFKKGVNDVFVRVIEPRQVDERGIWFDFDCFSLEKAEYGITGLTTEVKNNIFEQDEKIKATINFADKDRKEHTLFYSVRDYFGNSIKEETVQIKNTDKYDLTFDENQKLGHYSVYTELDGKPTGKNMWFSVVKDTDEREYHETSFSVDVCGTYYLLGSTLIEDYARALHLAGVTHVRERAVASWENPKQGEYNWTNPDRVYGAYEKYGIKVMPCTHDVQSWNRIENGKLPMDLKPVYEFAKLRAERYGENVEWEMWNEPDLANFATNYETADNFAAFLKAYALGVHDANVGSKAIAPSFAYPAGEYAELLMQNEVSKFADAYSFHGHRGSGTGTTEDGYLTVPPGWTSHIEFTKKYDMYHKPVYLTEAGVYTKLTSGKKDVEVERQRSQARYAATSLIESVAMNLQRDSYFVMPSVIEGQLQWGMFSNNHTPYQAYNVISALTDSLGEAKYVNAIPNMPEGVYAHVFKDGEDYVAAVWSETETQVSIASSSNEGKLIDIMGNSSDITAVDGKFTVNASPDVLYIRISGGFTGASEFKYAPKQNEPTELTDAQKIVITQTYPVDKRVDSKIDGYKLNPDEQTAVQVEVYNFNDKKMNGKIKAQSFAGWVVSPKEQEVELDASGKATLSFSITGSDEVADGVQVPLQFIGEFDGKETTRSVTNIRTIDYGEITPVYTKETKDASRWIKNVAGGALLEIVQETSDVISVDCTFADGDKWLYPQFVLDETTNYGGSAGFIYDIYFEEEPVDFTPRVYVYETNGCGYFLSAGIKGLKQGWNTVTVPWSSFSAFDGAASDDNFHLDTEEIVKISVGINSRVEKGAFKIRNIGYYNLKAENIFPEINIISPMKGATAVENEINIEADITGNKIGVDYSTVGVEIDEKKIDSSCEGGKVTAKVTLMSGKHTMKIKVYDLTGKVVQSIIEFTTE